jgi:hypothetical protein
MRATIIAENAVIVKRSRRLQCGKITIFRRRLIAVQHCTHKRNHKLTHSHCTNRTITLKQQQHGDRGDRGDRRRRRQEAQTGCVRGVGDSVEGGLGNEHRCNVTVRFFFFPLVPDATHLRVV